MKIKDKKEYKLSLYEITHKGETYYYNWYDPMFIEHAYDDKTPIMNKVGHCYLWDKDGNRIVNYDLLDKIQTLVFKFDFKQ